MNGPRHSTFAVRAGALVALAVAATALSTSPAGAHFVLQSPASWKSQDSFGGPQKLGPCGDEGAGKLTGEVTAFQQGQTITVTIDEKVFHPGHYRISLAVNDRSELPAEPVVTPGSSACGTVDIESPPVFPVLADGVFPHTSPFSGPQSVDVTLPPDVTCDHCTLQVIEFMSEHGLNNPGGCFYHHCADISIGHVAVDGGTPDAGEAGTAGAAGGARPSPESPAASSSGGCSVQRSRAPVSLVGVMAALLWMVGRRRRSR